MPNEDLKLELWNLYERIQKCSSAIGLSPRIARVEGAEKEMRRHLDTAERELRNAAESVRLAYLEISK